MSLNKQQFEFTHAIGLLIAHIYSRGYTASLGDAWSKKEYKAHSKNSKHYDRLAIDINLFKDGKYLAETEDHRIFGEYWEELGGTWGGRFRDGNHYSWNEV